VEGQQEVLAPEFLTSMREEMEELMEILTPPTSSPTE
jgi:hypothetical protein